MPEASGTSAWPPSLPSVPTSLATRVTSAANELELIDHRVDGGADAQELALHRLAVDLQRHLLRQVALGDRADDPRDLGRRLHQVADERVDRVELARPAAGCVARSAARSVMRPSRPTTRSTRTISFDSASFRATIELNSAAMARITAGWTPAWPLAPLPFEPFPWLRLELQPDGEVPLPGRAQCSKQSPQRAPARRSGAVTRRPSGTDARRTSSFGIVLGGVTDGPRASFPRAGSKAIPPGTRPLHLLRVVMFCARWTARRSTSERRKSRRPLTVRMDGGRPCRREHGRSPLKVRGHALRRSG